MAGNIQSLIFDIVARDSASPAFARLGKSASGASGNVSDLSKRIDELGRKSAEARVGLQGDKEAQARLDRLDATLLTLTHRSANPNISIEGAARAAAEISALELQLDKLGAREVSAAGAASGLAGKGGGGMPAGAGLGALIAAGVILSPVIATVATGLAGFGVAAYGAVGPIANAAQKTGGLQKNMHLLNPEQQALATSLLGLGKQYHAFEQQLAPQVFGVFNEGLNLAGHLMHDFEPVAAATGTALDIFLTRIDKEFQSGTWQGFFGFMARTAGPDIKLLGDNFIGLMNILPPLLEQLQPLAMAMLTLTSDVLQVGASFLKVTQQGQAFIRWSQDVANTTAHSSTAFGGFWKIIRTVTDFLPTGQSSFLRFAGGLDTVSQSAGKAGGSMKTDGLQAQTLTTQLDVTATAVRNLMTAQQTALGVQVGYGSSLVTTANDAQALRDKLKLSWGMIGLQTQAQRDSFAAANTYITDLGNQATQALKSGHGVDAAMTAIRNGLPLLDSAKTHNRQYWLEVQTLVGWLDRLRAEKAIREVVIVSGSGSWTMQLPRNQSLPGGFPGGTGAAAGMLVTGGVPGRDSVPILAMPGEAVVPAQLTPMLAPFLRAHGVPGFASGGVIPSYSGRVPGLEPWITHNSDAQIRVFGQATAAAVVAGIRSAQSVSGAAGPGGGAPSANAALARSMFPVWASGPEWGAWNYLAMRESGWNQFARNPSSGAYGIAQALPPTKMPFAAQAAGGSNPAAQIGWMAGYIASTYGDPIRAAQHEAAFNWYDGGGSLRPGVTLAVNTSGRAESVLGSRAETLLDEIAGRLDEIAGLLAANNQLTARAPAATGAGLGAALGSAGRASTYRALYS
jgi:hypothetical protein